MKKQGLLIVIVAAMCWALAPQGRATPQPPKTPKAPKEDTSPKTEFKDIPTLQDGPGKGYYAIFQCKLYDALVVASNLNVLVYPKEQGERIDKPIEFSNRFVYSRKEGDPPDLMTFTGVKNLAPPAVLIPTSPKITIQAVAASGLTLIQSWKFSEGTIAMEEHFKGTLADPLPVMRTFFSFPQTHKFTPNIETADRMKAMAGYTFRWRAGKDDKTMKTIDVPYVGKPESLGAGDWVENKGPWGARKITIKRKSNKGSIGMGTQWNKCLYDGIEMCFTAKPDPTAKIKKIDPQGFDMKIE